MHGNLAIRDEVGQRHVKLPTANLLEGKRILAVQPYEFVALRIAPRLRELPGTGGKGLARSRSEGY